METSGEVVLFFREIGFYPVQLSGLKATADEVPDHVALNPGTTRVENLHGDVIWPPKVTQ
jgi:hypothetical protein